MATTTLAEEIAGRLRAARAKLDLTQEQAGDLAGMSWMSIHRYEHGRLPTIEALYRLARVYGVQPIDLLPELPPRKGRT